MAYLRKVLREAGLPTLPEAEADLARAREGLFGAIVDNILQERELIASGESCRAPTTKTPPHLYFLDIPAHEDAVIAAIQLVQKVEHVINTTPH